MEVAGRTFLISGGRSGLGAATASLLEAGGAQAVIADLPETDVTDEAAVQQLVDSCDELHGAVNCAGIGGGGRVVGKDGPYPLDAFRKIVEVNLVGTFNVIRLVATRLAQNEPTASGERGVIVNTASIAAFEGQIGQLAYAASKAGVVGLTLPAARDLATVGIRVCTIAPGIIDTPMLGTLSEEIRAGLAAGVPFPKRLGSPADYAFLVCVIAEDGYLNGETIRMDAALRMAPR